MRSSDILNIKLNTDYFLINWHPTRWCNYHCSYCIGHKEKYIKEEDILQTAEYINNFINTLPSDKLIYFKLLGGEISVYDWTKILSKIDRIDKINFTTNFSNSLDYYKKLYEYTTNRNIKFFLMCSKHSENKEYDEKIIELTKWCNDNNYSLPIARLMVDNTFNFDNYNYLKNHNVKLNLSIIRDKSNAIEKIDDKIFSFMKQYWQKENSRYKYATVSTKDNSFSISNAVQFTNTLDEGGFDPTGFLCSAGHNGIFLEPDGMVYRCGCNGVIANTDKKIHISEYKIDNINGYSKCFINNTNNENKQYCSLCWYVNLKK